MYAERYGWTRDYILNCIYIDDHLILSDIIYEKDQEQKRQEYLMQAYLHMLPYMKDDAREEFLNNLSSTKEEETIDVENMKTDLEAIKKAKKIIETI